MDTMVLAVFTFESGLMNVQSLQGFIGRRALYMEGGKIVVVRVEEAKISDTGMSAVVAFDESVPLSCAIRRFRVANEELVKSWGQSCPVGLRWEIAEQWPFLECQQDRWGASQVGFRLLFAEEAINRFERRDMSWIDEYYE
jgi:hypothetical protein